MKFGDKLQNLRKASSLSQEQLADKLNVSRQAVSKWESNASYPEMDKLITMTKIFKCSMDDLVNDEVPDKTIITHKAGKVNEYIDSLLEFITDSVNMLFSMRFFTLLKTLFELFIVGFVLFIILAIVISLSENFFNGLFGYTRFGYHLSDFLTFLISGILLAFEIIVFLQIYRVRYLDYYRRELYNQEQKKSLDIKVEETKENKDEVASEKKRKILFKKQKEPKIIIRDSNDQSFKFLEGITKIIKLAVKTLVIFFAIWFVPSLVFFIISSVISIYLIHFNFIFFGITLALISLIVVNIEVLDIVYNFILDKKINYRMLAIIFLAAVFIFSIGGGLSFIKLRDFKFIEEYEETEIFKKSMDYNKDIIITGEGSIDFIVDDSVKNIEIEVEYNKDNFDIDLIDELNYSVLEIDYKNYEYNKTINRIISDLKNSTIRDYDDSWIFPKQTITSNKKIIENLLKNLSRLNYITIKQEKNIYHVSVDDFIGEDAICRENDKGITRCLTIEDDGLCKVKVDDEGKVSSSERGCYCDHVNTHQYYCYRKDILLEDFNNLE